ncbi:MAG: AAA family ATPase [Roseiarcus sp.]|jgi:predicted ATPase
MEKSGVDEVGSQRDSHNSAQAIGDLVGEARKPREAEAPSVIPSDPSVGVPDARPARLRKWSKLENVAIANFKAIRQTTIPLGDVTILVGPNGSGKSSVLQAVHWSVRAASYIAPKNAKEMMSFDRIDYLPSSEPLKTAHKDELKSDTKSDPTTVIFNHVATSNEEAAQSATVKIFAARNRGGITAHIEGGAAVTPYKQRDSFITAYIPGLAGLAEKETILAQPLLRRQAASGDAGGVLRNVLYNLASRLPTDREPTAGTIRLARLNALVQDVHQGVEVNVEFDAREDYNISASYRDSALGGRFRSLETAATGLLQVIQIFAYIILFRPRIVLIDEPDAHLHPDKQERLVEALEQAAAEFETQIVMTTHSPHVVRAASPNAKLVWMANGEVRTDDDDAIRKMLGWGGLDKDVYFFVEDECDKAIRAILRQWPALSRRVAVCPCFGVDNLPKERLLEGLLTRAGLELKAVIHRDRDFMTDAEVVKWREAYAKYGAFPWVCAEGDVESHFCRADYLAALYNVDLSTAEAWRAQAAAAIPAAKAKAKFFEKRKVVNWAVYREDGGSPSSEALWDQGGGPTPQNQLGKSLFKALKPILKAAGHDDKLLDSFKIPVGYEMGKDLKETLEQALLKQDLLKQLLS